MIREHRSWRPGRLWVGTSGYQYDHWRGIFYPERLPLREWFTFYSKHFDTVEINNSFYRLPSGEVFEKWREQTPRGFTYAVKFSRFGSHMKKLLDPEGTIGLFLGRAERLGKHLGPILVQLPPRWKMNVERLDNFLRVAPRRHRWAVEMRDASWLHEEVYAVLEKHNAALCFHDILPDHPWRATADWAYVRFHGAAAQKYCGCYKPAMLRSAAKRLRELSDQGKDCFVYFNNDALGFALKNAVQLRQYLAKADTHLIGPRPRRRGAAGGTKSRPAGHPRGRSGA